MNPSCTCEWTSQVFTIAELRDAARTDPQLKQEALACLKGLSGYRKIDGIVDLDLAEEQQGVMAHVGKIAAHARRASWLPLRKFCPVLAAEDNS